MSILRIAVVISTLALAGCSNQKDADAEEQIRKGHIFQDQARALEKAKGVEQAMQDASAQQRRQMDNQDQ
jgi:outer membrane murein-binding lipoprotein Lpp